MKNIKEIKEAIKEPASKEWFAKHGLPKGLGPKQKMIEKMGVKGYKHSKWHSIDGEKRGYEDPKTGTIYPSKGAFKDRYQGK